MIIYGVERSVQEYVRRCTSICFNVVSIVFDFFKLS